MEKGKFVEICFNGKLKNKLVKKVKKGFPLVGRDTGAGKGTKIALCMTRRGKTSPYGNTPWIADVEALNSNQDIEHQH